MKKISTKVVKILKEGGIGVIPTDTLYGLVGIAFSKDAIDRIYKLKKRNNKKPFIILIKSIKDLDLFDIKIDSKTLNILNKVWPGKVSVILPIKSKKYYYLHRGCNALCFRMPRKKSLINLLKKTGPLVAPSANIENKIPAKNLRDAKKYFSDKVDFYIAGGELDSKPSTIIEIINGKGIIRRK